MDKIKLNTMGLYPAVEPIYVDIGAASVAVTPYIPYEEMLNMIQWCIDFVINDRPFLSAPLVRIMKDFAVLKFYTNFDFGFMEEFTEMSEIYGEYDLIQRFGVMEKVHSLIDDKQLTFFNVTLDETLQSIMSYRNSAVGIVDALAENAKANTKDMESAMAILGDDEQSQKLASLINFANVIAGDKSIQDDPPALMPIKASEEKEETGDK